MEGRYDRFTTMIAALYQNIQKVKMLEMENFDLRTIHATCLHHFSQHPSGLTLKELTELCEVDKAAMSRCVAELQEKGLVHSEDVSTTGHGSSPTGAKMWRSKPTRKSMKP